MESVNEFLKMGGYAPFVWPAFAIAAAVLTLLLAWSLRDLRRERSLLDSLRGRRSEARPAESGDDP